MHGLIERTEKVALEKFLAIININININGVLNEEYNSGLRC